ncbi:hypothetical protein HDU89_002413 [Geranomyces variabilis]|nr:hypothetical protein HDU89_002413 [Geranomyces variabilis]
MWVFGYGSLIWKVDFPYETRIPGFVRGYVRRFWQGSKDHRGTPTNLGRVVTLIPHAEYLRVHSVHDPHAETTDDESTAECWGVAYRIADADVEAVKAHLDHREKNGYDCVEVDVYHPAVKGADGELVPVVHGALVYCATLANDSFLGPDAGIDAIARQIALTKGPSGWNADYLLALCHSMQVLAPDYPDQHLVALERAVRHHIELINAADPPPAVLRVFPDFANGDAEVHRVLEVDVAEVARLEKERTRRAPKPPKDDTAKSESNELFFRRSSNYLVGIFAGAFAFEIAFDSAADRLWDMANKGRQWKDIRSKYIQAADSEPADDEE